MQTKTKYVLTGGAVALALAAGGSIAWGQSFGYQGRAGMLGGRLGMMGGRLGLGGQGLGGQGMNGSYQGGASTSQAGPGYEMMNAPQTGPTIDFAAADTNGDGKVTPAELATWQAKQVGSIDANGDGKLSADEIAQFELKQIATWTQAQAQSMVKQLDANGDGLLSASELLAQPMTDVGFSQLDRNHDGVLTGDELKGPPIGHGTPGSFGSYPQYGNASAAPNDTQNNGNSASGN